VVEFKQVRTQPFLYQWKQYFIWNLAYATKYLFWKLAVISGAMGIFFFLCGYSPFLSLAIVIGVLAWSSICLIAMVAVRVSGKYAREAFQRFRYTEISASGILVSADNGSESIVAWTDIQSVTWNADRAVVRLKSRQGFFIPTEAFSSQQDLATAKAISLQYTGS
jgi:hypothetical protein